MPVAVAAWGASIAVTVVPPSAPGTALGGWAAVLLGLALLARRSSPVLLVVVLGLSAMAATASHVALAQPSRAQAIELAGAGGRAVEVTAEVVGKVERWSTGELVFDAVATRLSVGGDPHSLAAVPIRVRIDAADVEITGSLDVGATVTAVGSVRASDPGERAVFTVLSSRGWEITRPASGAAAVAGGLRQGLVAATSGLPSPGAGLVPGLAVGDTSGVDPALDTAMKQASLSHLTAVSGANCALVVGLAFAAAAAAGAARVVRVAVALAALGGFVLLVTPEPSVARAAVMAAVAMLAVALGRPAVGMSVLSLAIGVLLVGDPWLSTSLGFALSAAATASLLVLARPLAAGLQRFMPRMLALGLSVPLSAQLACAPLIVLIEPSVSIYGVAANLLAAPAAPIATVVGLAACLALPLPVLQAGLTGIAWLPAAWIAGTAHTFATLPGGQVPWTEGWWGAAGLVVLGAATAVVLVPRSRRVGILTPVAGTLIAVAVGASAGTAALEKPMGPLTLPSAWAILACDVGQGDAVLIRSAGAVALVDTGPDPAPLSQCLDRAGVSRIDLLVLTHFDLDHAGGVAAVVGRVDEVRHGPPASPDDREVLDQLATGGAALAEASAGQSGSLGDAGWRVLWPPRDSKAFTGGNDASVVLDIAGGGVPRTLLLGDLSATPQRALSASQVQWSAYDVVKVAHHGSADQDAGLYAKADAAVALVTVGSGNSHGHPREELLSVLDDLGSAVARTDRDGMVAIWRSVDGVDVWRERGGVGGSG